MMAFMSARPDASTGTAPIHWDVTLTAAIVDVAMFDRASIRRVAVVMAVHHSSGTCSAPPPGSSNSATRS
jgi:hypothetical protein